MTSRTAEAEVDSGLLIVVSGLPASGKTTLARTLSRRLSLPVVERDRLAEVCYDALGPGCAVPLGSVSYELLFHVAREYLRSGRSVLVESNFSRARHENQLRALVQHTGHRITELHCHAPATCSSTGTPPAQSGANGPPATTTLVGSRSFAPCSPTRPDAATLRRCDALIFPDVALLLDTTTDLSIDGVVSRLATAARPSDQLSKR